MTVLVVGATGSIGRLVVGEAIGQGYTVRALVRSAAKARQLPSAAQVFKGDVTRPETLTAAVAPGDPARMAARIIESVDVEPAPLRMVLGSQALEGTIQTLRKRIEGFEAQTDLAASTDFPPGE